MRTLFLVMSDLEYQQWTLRKFPLFKICVFTSADLNPWQKNTYHHHMQTRSILNWATSQNRRPCSYKHAHLTVESIIKHYIKALCVLTRGGGVEEGRRFSLPKKKKKKRHWNTKLSDIPAQFQKAWFPTAVKLVKQNLLPNAESINIFY